MAKKTAKKETVKPAAKAKAKTPAVKPVAKTAAKAPAKSAVKPVVAKAKPAAKPVKAEKAEKVEKAPKAEKEPKAPKPPKETKKAKAEKLAVAEGQVRWADLHQKYKAEKPQVYNMSAQFEANKPIQHKVLGWGYVLSNENDRLEVLFEQGIKMLISNYKST
jgi:hypothetical protein